MQQEEIKIFTEELKAGKAKLEAQLRSQMELFKRNSEMALDAERFGQLTRGLHVTTTVEERFEEVSAVYKFQKEGTLLHKVSPELLLVNGPDKSIDILSAKDLSVAHNLETDGGEMAFCACEVNNLLFVGCNAGEVYIYDALDKYAKCGHIKLREKVSQMKVLACDDGQKHLICC